MMTDFRARAALADEPPEPIPPAALPEGYIDPEHSWDDRALLQTFYSACQAEGGTADEVTLQGLRAVLARWGNPAPTPPADGEVAELVAWLQEEADDYECIGCEDSAAKCKRVAELLERLASPACVVLKPSPELIEAFQDALPGRIEPLLEERHPAPPADGEVAELTGQLIEAANGAAAMGWDQHARSILRAAELLQRQVPVPEAGSERPWEREGWCDELGRCWWGRPDTGDWSADWTLATPEAIAEFCEFSPRTVCLPAHALPLPEVGE